MRKDKLRLLAGGRCFYCGVECIKETPRNVGHAHIGSVDHATPRSRGGSGKAENLVFACMGCNRLKMTRDFEGFRLLMGLRAGRLPYRFHGEETGPVARDMLTIVSPKMIPALVRHNVEAPQ